MTPEKLREWLVGIEKDFAWSIGKRDMEALAQLRAMIDAQRKPSQVVGTDSATQPEIRFCAECGTPLGVKDDAQGEWKEKK